MAKGKVGDTLLIFGCFCLAAGPWLLSGWSVLGAISLGLLFIVASHFFTPFVSRLGQFGNAPMTNSSHIAIVESKPKDT